MIHDQAETLQELKQTYNLLLSVIKFYRQMIINVDRAYVQLIIGNYHTSSIHIYTEQMNQR